MNNDNLLLIAFMGTAIQGLAFLVVTVVAIWIHEPVAAGVCGVLAVFNVFAAYAIGWRSR